MDVISVINTIRERKTANKIKPEHATLKELISEGVSIEEIKELVKSGTIKEGRTINSNYYEIKRFNHG